MTQLDRIARSAREGLAFIDGLLDKGIKVHVLNLGLMDDSATGKLIRTIFLGFAEFERDMIMQRTAEGKAVARLQPGYKEGRKEKYSKAQIDHAMKLLEESNSYRQVAEMTGISKSTLIRKKKELAV